MLGGGVIAGELWWPGQKLISIPKSQELRYIATERYSYGWTDMSGAFGLAPVRAEGTWVKYDGTDPEELLQLQEKAKRLGVDPEDEDEFMLTEANLEQMVVDVRRDLKDKMLSIKPTTVTFDRDEAKRQARVLGSDHAHGVRLNEKIVRVADEEALTDPDDWYIKVPHVHA